MFHVEQSCTAAEPLFQLFHVEHSLRSPEKGHKNSPRYQSGIPPETSLKTRRIEEFSTVARFLGPILSIPTSVCKTLFAKDLQPFKPFTNPTLSTGVARFPQRKRLRLRLSLYSGMPWARSSAS